MLGPQFSSLMMFVVGYPRYGKNKKNHYCKRGQQVIEKYQYFMTLPSYEKKIVNCADLVSKKRMNTSFVKPDPDDEGS